MYCVYCHVFLSVHCLFIAALWSHARKGLTSWLSCVWCFLVFLSLSHVVSWLKWGSWLYRFLIFAFLFTLNAIPKNKILKKYFEFTIFLPESASPGLGKIMKKIFPPTPSHTKTSVPYRLTFLDLGFCWDCLFWLVFVALLGFCGTPGLLMAEPPVGTAVNIKRKYTVHV